MVRRQLQGYGITDPAVLAAMCEIPREHFVPAEWVSHACADRALPIPAGQTISQPRVVALMLEALQLQPGDHVLEVGTGSGYVAALLGRLAARVDSVERHAELVVYARTRLAALGIANVTIHEGDGTLGLPERAPFEAIVVSAGGPRIPASLCDQLAVGGRLVMPVGQRNHQTLVRLTRTDERNTRRETLAAVAFVPLIGREGWEEPEQAAPAATE
jgi:protein-L-isoaspartate(D-aspartate) O-methyltransferase